MVSTISGTSVAQNMMTNMSHVIQLTNTSSNENTYKLIDGGGE